MHSTLQIHIVPPKNAIWQHQSTPKRPLKELVDEAFCDRYGQGPCQPPEDLHMDLDQLLEDPSLPDEIVKPAVMVTPHPFLQKEAANAAREAKVHYDHMHSHFIASAQQHMDACIGVVESILQQALDTKNLTLYWQCLWEAIEGSIIVLTGKEHEADV